MAALNRMIDKAPTSPSDNAKDDLTMVIISIVVIVRSKKFLANSFLFDKDLPNLKYTQAKINDKIAASNRLKIKDIIGISVFEVERKLLNCCKFSMLSNFFFSVVTMIFFF